MVIGVVVVPGPRCKIDQGFIWPELTGHTTHTMGVFVTDQPKPTTTINKSRKHQDQDPRSQASGAREIGPVLPQHGTVCFCNNGVRALDQACFLGPPSQQRSGTMTRTRSPSGGRLPGEGTIAQPIDHLMLPVLVCYFFSSWPPRPPNGQHICTDGTSLVISSSGKSQSYLPPISSSSVVDHLHSWAIVGSSGSLAIWYVGSRHKYRRSPLPPFLPKLGADTSSRCQFRRPRTAARLSGSCPSLPLVSSSNLVSALHNMPARTGLTGRQAGKPRQQGKSTQTTLEVRMMITDRAFLLFQEVTAAVY